MSEQEPTRKIATVMVDRPRCFSHEKCVIIAPQVFSMDYEDISVAGDISKVDDATLLRAARACPMYAIIVLDDQGNQIYPGPDDDL